MSCDKAQDVLTACMWLSSPALPVGGFSWSQGLESAVESATVRDYASLLDYLEGMLEFALTRWDLPLLCRFLQCCIKQDGTAFLKLDAVLKAGRGTEELYAEECAMGRALKSLVRSLGLFPDWLDLNEEFGYVSMFALSGFMRIKDYEECFTPYLMHAYAFGWLQNQTSVACKAVPLGQTDAQRVLIALQDKLKRAVQQALVLEDNDLGCALAGSFMFSAQHEHQYSRLFRS
ncbi:MAG: hypothetical protein K6F05_07220 [Succinivibrio sp.]|nr:hypothetical protein [Succinivibrio sp.]